MMTIDPKEIPVAKMHGYLLGAVAPRPIAFASTIDKDGNVNLSPFSFFNVFSANPPVVIFSPARRGRDNTTKHSYENVLQVPEACISVVSYDMVQQMSLASTEYAKGVNEFVKAGFTQIPSERIRPPRVGEAKITMECKVNQVVALGDGGAAGNLVICEVLLMHVKEEVLDVEGKIDPNKLDAVARMGGDWYCRASGNNLFRLPQPATKIGIGIDQLPKEIRESTVLTGSDLAILAGVESLPIGTSFKTSIATHKEAKQLLDQNEVNEAWSILVTP